ncbi:MAG: hypothetical protein J6J31_10210 [Thermoguttaceae bacterium]|nr:hypothetical protein [Thermoguttaceae bacterium]
MPRHLRNVSVLSDSMSSGFVSPTGEIHWNGEEPGKAYFLADTPKTKFFTEKIAGRSFIFRDGTRLTPGETLLDWASISLTQTSENTWLLAAKGIMKNSGTSYRPYDQPEMEEDAVDLRALEDTKLFSPKRGQMPRLCEGIPLSLVLPVSAPKTVAVSALNSNAEKIHSEACSIQRISDSEVEIRISPETQTLWYLLEIVSPDDQKTGDQKTGDQKTKR